MGAMASQITQVFTHPDQRKHQSSASLAFVRGIHRRPMNSPHKGPVTRKMFHRPFHCLFNRLFWLTSNKALISCFSGPLSWWIHQMETFTALLAFCAGNSPVTRTEASDAELWCFLWSEPGRTTEQTMETQVIWDAIALIMTSLLCEGMIVQAPVKQPRLKNGGRYNTQIHNY